jgi:hypothetical protein
MVFPDLSLPISVINGHYLLQVSDLDFPPHVFLFIPTPLHVLFVIPFPLPCLLSYPTVCTVGGILPLSLRSTPLLPNFKICFLTLGS